MKVTLRLILTYTNNTKLERNEVIEESLVGKI